MRLGDSNAMSNVEVVPTGALTGSDYAKRKVQEEIQRYKYRMDRERTKYKVISEEVQEDGSLLWRLLESMATISQQDII